MQLIKKNKQKMSVSSDVRTGNRSLVILFIMYL